MLLFAHRHRLPSTYAYPVTLCASRLSGAQYHGHESSHDSGSCINYESLSGISQSFVPASPSFARDEHLTLTPLQPSSHGL